MYMMYMRFSVGGKGASGAHVAYISRPGAVGDDEGQCGFVLQGMPEEMERATTYEELREWAVSFAEVREREEAGKGKPTLRRTPRTHYRALVSFERKMETGQASALVREWLKAALPTARALAFVHQNTDHTHAHIWIDARKADGRKLHFPAQQYRRLDEIWNRIYSRAMGRDEREHLEKKGQRVERGDERRGAVDAGERTTGPEQPAARSRRTTPGERSIASAERALAAVADADRCAVRSVDCLRGDLKELDRAAGNERQNSHPEQGQERDP